MSDLEVLARRHAPKPPAGVVVARRSRGAVEVASAGPQDAGAVFELGSITKAVTGLLPADAVVRGELVALATHTAGLPRLPLALLRRVGFTNTRDPYAGTTVQELVDDLARVRLRTPRRRYSNLGAALLGQALAARAGAPYEQLVEERVLRPLGIGEVWADGAPRVAQPHDRRGRPVEPWTLGAYAPAGCLRGTARGALAISIACTEPPPAIAEAVALALTPRAGDRMLEVGFGWLRSPAHRGARMWWHNGGTNGSRSFTAFIRAGLARSLDHLPAIEERGEQPVTSPYFECRQSANPGGSDSSGSSDEPTRVPATRRATRGRPLDPRRCRTWERSRTARVVEAVAAGFQRCGCSVGVWISTLDVLLMSLPSSENPANEWPRGRMIVLPSGRTTTRDCTSSISRIRRSA